MPPKKTTTPGAKATSAPKSTAAKPTTKPGAKTGAAKSGTAAKPAAAAKAAPKEAPKPAEPVRKPVTFTEIIFKELDSKVVFDKAGTIKATGKWPLVVDENGLTPRFLRHRDVNMLTAPDNTDMEPEKIRKALLGSIKFGKPFVIDMMESEMYEYIKDQFDKIEPNLLNIVLDKTLIGDDYKYMSIVKEEDGEEFQNQYNYNSGNFSFMITTQLTAPNEDLLQKMYPVKINN